MKSLKTVFAISTMIVLSLVACTKKEQAQEAAPAEQAAPADTGAADTGAAPAEMPAPEATPETTQ